MAAGIAEDRPLFRSPVGQFPRLVGVEGGPMLGYNCYSNPRKLTREEIEEDYDLQGCDLRSELEAMEKTSEVGHTDSVPVLADVSDVESSWRNLKRWNSGARMLPRLRLNDVLCDHGISHLAVYHFGEWARPLRHWFGQGRPEGWSGESWE